MKRILLLLLLAAVLCGCSTAPAEPTTAAATVPQELPEPTEPQGIYVPLTPIEEQSNGSLRCYRPDLYGCYSIRAMGSDLLLFSGFENTTLTRLSGDNLFPVAQTTLNCIVLERDTSFQISDRGITYFDDTNREVVYLDNDLKEVSRLPVPEKMIGKPILSADRMRLYYVTADAVRVHDLETGLDRLIRSVSYPVQVLEDILLPDEILRIGLVDERGQYVSQFLLPETGELIRAYTGNLELTVDGENYYCRRSDGLLSLLQFRLGSEPEKALYLQEGNAKSFFLPGSQRVIAVESHEAGTALRGYDLKSGLCAWSVDVQEQIGIWEICESPAGQYVYLLGDDLMLGQTVILRWMPEGTPGNDDTVYTGPVYTREDPDQERLDRCREYAAVLEEKYGITILLGEAAVQDQPWDYTLEEEHQASLILAQLETLEKCLEIFPENFFRKTNENIRFLLVRSIRANAESGSVAEAAGLQFWYGETPCVALCPGEGMRNAFFHEFFHLMDSKILSDSRAYYHWDNLNPEGFAYFEDYTSYLTQDLGDWLENETRAFIDTYSASFPREDRARIMEYACTPGNAGYFQSETMQRKLEVLCQGIREAYKLDAATGSLLWEQYLLTAE